MHYPFANQHQAEAVLITCIDFRFHELTTEYVKTHLAKSFDLLTMPGTAKNFVAKNQLASEAVRIIKDVCIGLHQVKKIILLGHWDCGGYGGSKNFDSTHAEAEKYEYDLRQAKLMLKKEFPALDVIIGYSRIDGEEVKFIMMD